MKPYTSIRRLDTNHIFKLRALLRTVLYYLLCAALGIGGMLLFMYTCANA